MAFDMTKVKVGDKLVQRDGTIVELDHVWDYETTYQYQLSNGDSLTKDGYFWKDRGESEYDVIGFADENQQANCTFTETQAVELLLSLGYTLKKGV